MLKSFLKINLESLQTVFKGSIFCMPALQDLLSRDTDLEGDSSQNVINSYVA